jgi:hypothetical protein
MTATNPNRLKIATQIHAALRRELAHDIEVERLLTRERYARDVLLVCDALRGTELPLLAAEFRRTTPVAPAAGDRAPPSGAARVSPGFAPTRPPEEQEATPTTGTRPAAGWRTRLPWR